jgi:predicted O-methyltransferase YrrM
MHVLRWIVRSFHIFAGHLRRLAEEFVVRLASRRVSSFVEGRPTIDDAVAFAYERRFWRLPMTIVPIQLRSEISSFLEHVLANDVPPRRILEIGTSQGGTLFLLSTVAADDAEILSIDLPKGPFGGGYSERKEKLYRAFARSGQHIELLRQSSHDHATLARVKSWLSGSFLDLLFVDGDHTYGGVMKDLELYTPLVRPGGLIALHDIVPGLRERVGDVPRVWRRLRQPTVSSEIVESWSQGGFGIGVVRKTGPAGNAIALRSAFREDAGA